MKITIEINKRNILKTIFIISLILSIYYNLYQHNRLTPTCNKSTGISLSFEQMKQEDIEYKKSIRGLTEIGFLNRENIEKINQNLIKGTMNKEDTIDLYFLLGTLGYNKDDYTITPCGYENKNDEIKCGIISW